MGIYIYSTHIKYALYSCTAVCDSVSCTTSGSDWIGFRLHPTRCHWIICGNASELTWHHSDLTRNFEIGYIVKPLTQQLFPTSFKPYTQAMEN